MVYCNFFLPRIQLLLFVAILLVLHCDCFLQEVSRSMDSEGDIRLPSDGVQTTEQCKPSGPCLYLQWAASSGSCYNRWLIVQEGDRSTATDPCIGDNRNCSGPSGPCDGGRAEHSGDHRRMCRTEGTAGGLPCDIYEEFKSSGRESGVAGSAQSIAMFFGRAQGIGRQ